MSSTYRDSLNLPATDFPMRASLATREPVIMEKWDQDKLYEQVQQAFKGNSKYILHDGPPYANGHLHIGHAINKVLKDFVTKSKRLSGFNAPFVPGWDCHGLPIEINVEKLLKRKGKAYAATDFREACRAYAVKQVNIQKAEFKRLGVLADWENPYLTMDFKTEANTIRALGECIRQGHVGPGLKPVHWCTACQSALAESEVTYQNKSSTAVDVKFIVADHPWLDQLPGHGSLSVPIWTTTPWTLPANEAVAIGPDIEYALIQLPHERVLLAKSLYHSSLHRYGLLDQAKILNTYLGHTLPSLPLKHPFESRYVPLLTSEHVSIDKGTGAVHIAPSHGLEDYVLGLIHKLPVRSLVDGKGLYNVTEPLLHQQPVLKADQSILTLLDQHNTQLAAGVFEHSYPHCWRHNTPLIFRATTQWFLQLKNSTLKHQLKNAIETVQWIPNWGELRMKKMLLGTDQSERPDWCISRQRHWGVPLPLFIHRKTGEPHPKTLEFIETVATLVEKKGIEAWYQLLPETLLGEKETDYEKLQDVLDVWFDSGVTHQTVLEKNPVLQGPADLYLEGSDQFRGWFQSSLITSTVLTEQAPYRAILVHGFAVDPEGKKLSKSLGNAQPLETIIQKWGADILRLWISATDTRSEIVVSDETFQRTAEAYRRIRNTVRFLLSSFNDFNPETHLVEPKDLLSIDRWLLARTHTLQQKIKEAYDAFNFPIVYQTIHHFCTQELGSFYLSILKDRQYTMPANSVARRSGQTALYHVTHALLRWLAPIMSFTSEEAWQHLPSRQESSIFLTQWYKLPPTDVGDRLNKFYQEAKGIEPCWEQIIRVRECVNAAIEQARNQGIIGSALEANLVLYCDFNSFMGRLLQTIQKELHFIFLTSSVTLKAHHEATHKEAEVIAEVLPLYESQHKCERCWHRRVDVGHHSMHPKLCERCVGNITNVHGETRHYA